MRFYIMEEVEETYQNGEILGTWNGIEKYFPNYETRTIIKQTNKFIEIPIKEILNPDFTTTPRSHKAKQKEELGK